jgi:hypothetical protein
MKTTPGTKAMRLNVKNALVLLCLSPLFSFAQNEHWRVNLRGSGDFPTTKLAGANLEPGWGADLDISYNFMPHLGVYAGWGLHVFKTDDAPLYREYDFVETGYNAGLRFQHPIGETKFSYLAGAGAIYKHIEVENSSNDLVDDSEHGFGWEAELGVSYPVIKCIDVSLFGRYRALSREINLTGTTSPADLNYISGGIGITCRF